MPHSRNASLIAIDVAANAVVESLRMIDSLSQLSGNFSTERVAVDLSAFDRLAGNLPQVPDESPAAQVGNRLFSAICQLHSRTADLYDVFKTDSDIRRLSLVHSSTVTMGEHTYDSWTMMIFAIGMKVRMKFYPMLREEFWSSCIADFRFRIDRSQFDEQSAQAVWNRIAATNREDFQGVNWTTLYAMSLKENFRARKLKRIATPTAQSAVSIVEEIPKEFQTKQMTKKEVAKTLGCDSSTVTRDIRAGRLRYIQVSRQRGIYDRRQLE